MSTYKKEEKEKSDLGLKKIPVFPLTRPILFFFCADPAIFIAFQKKIKKEFHTYRP